ncbi:MAG: BON domain-containing protein [Chthoniobacterales bacterium]|nr:BON domain-containing protein [Chthoniobacterales bacterium]
MKRTTLSLLCVAALTVTASADDKNKKHEDDDGHSASEHAADNTGKNERDRDGDSKTSGDQSNSPEDIKITADIRRAVVADDSLTMTATNVKIITADGVVTLRGPVNTAAEKAKIGEIAQKHAGKAKVENQLEVKTSH